MKIEGRHLYDIYKEKRHTKEVSWEKDEVFTVVLYKKRNKGYSLINTQRSEPKETLGLSSNVETRRIPSNINMFCYTTYQCPPNLSLEFVSFFCVEVQTFFYLSLLIPTPPCFMLLSQAFSVCFNVRYVLIENEIRRKKKETFLVTE